MHSEDSPQRDDTKLQSPISLNPTRENEATYPQLPRPKNRWF
jgi:hypothetical protein